MQQLRHPHLARLLAGTDVPAAERFNLDDVARVLSMSRRHVQRLAEAGDLQAYRFGPRSVVVHVDDLERFLSQAFSAAASGAPAGAA